MYQGVVLLFQRDVTIPPKELDQKNGLKGPIVTAIIPEAGRSIPGQDEVARKGDGGLHQCWRAIRLDELGIGAKG